MYTIFYIGHRIHNNHDFRDSLVSKRYPHYAASSSEHITENRPLGPPMARRSYSPFPPSVIAPTQVEAIQPAAGRNY